MDQLGNDVLLEVMQHLSTEDLLRCRLVCKRFGALALHPSLWRSRSLETDIDPKLTCAVLRLAPCLKSLKVVFPLDGCDHVLWARCAVKHLKLYTSESTCVNDAILVLKRQELLGRLKDLHVAGCWELDVDSQMMMYKALTFTFGLEKLTICFPCAPHGFVVLKRKLESLKKTALPCFIKSLTYFGDLEHDPFFSFIVNVHSASLEAVSLLSVKPLSPSYLPLLLGLPKLSKLSCQPLPGMEALAACKTLEFLTLNLSPHEVSSPAAAVQLLREARQLRVVSLSHEKDVWILSEAPYDVDLVIGVLAKLVLALASSGKSSVEVLFIDSLDSIKEDCSPLEHALHIAVPRLPALIKLYSSHSMQLRGVSPTVAAEVLGKLVLG